MTIPTHHALEVAVGTGEFKQMNVSRGTACRALSRRPAAHAIGSDLVARCFARQAIPRTIPNPVILPAQRNEGSAAKDLSVTRSAALSSRNGSLIVADNAIRDPLRP